MIEIIIETIKHNASVDTIYLYGSRAKQTYRENSDWDIAVLFSNYEIDFLERISRSQLLEATLERELNFYNRLSIIDLENVPIYLQFSVIMTGIKIFDRNVPHVKRIENSIISKWEKDYERYCLRTSHI